MLSEPERSLRPAKHSHSRAEPGAREAELTGVEKPPVGYCIESGQAAARGEASSSSIASSQQATSRSHVTTRPVSVDEFDTYSASLSMVMASPLISWRR